MREKVDGSQMAEVMRLGWVEGLSIRAISRRLQVSRKTVSKLLGRTQPRRRTERSERTSILNPYEPLIRTILSETPEMKAPAMLERLRAKGYQGGVSLLRERMRSWRPRPAREAFLTLDFAPGAAVQVDWADFGFALPGCPRRVSGFVMALCYSRVLYLEFALSQSMGTFLRCMERGLRFFGGTTHADIFDNMKTVVLSHTAQGTVFNPRFLHYAQTRGPFAVVACNVRRGNEKGRVERPIGFIRERFFLGRRFEDLMDLNAQATRWLDEFANTRIHEVTGKVPALVFAHEEKRLLRPLSEAPFSTDDIETQTVTKLFRVRFDRNTYSIPWRLVGQTVVIRADDYDLNVFLGSKQVARHRRSWSVGQDLEDPSHKRDLLDHKPRAQHSLLPPPLVGLGDIGLGYFKTLSASSRSLARETIRITFLVELFGEKNTAQAIAEVMQTGHVGSEYVEYVLRHKKGYVPNLPPLKLGKAELDSLHFHDPDLSLYDQLVSPHKTQDPGDPVHNDPFDSAPDGERS